MHFILLILSTFFCLAMLITGLLNLRRVRRDWLLMRRHSLPASLPLISVCVPARNEARNIAACMKSLIAQNYPNFELLVLDDCSEDETGVIVRSIAAGYSNVHILAGRPLPPGLVGKPHACAQLAEGARGEWLLFTDADTVFTPVALDRALRLALARRADLLSGVPALPVVTIWERLSVPMLGLAGFGSLLFSWITNRPWPNYAVASGAFLFFRREAYNAIGGHHAVRTRIVEDIELARAIKRADRRLVLTDAAPILSCRMYASFHEVWEGFTKNFYAAMPGALSLLGIFGLWAIYVIPWISYFVGPYLGWGVWRSTVLPLIQLTSIFILKAVVDHRSGQLTIGGLLLLPFMGIFSSLIALRSVSRAFLRQPTPWRARHYELWKEDQS